jgi:hypothetical protein
MRTVDEVRLIKKIVIAKDARLLCSYASGCWEVLLNR